MMDQRDVLAAELRVMGLPSDGRVSRQIPADKREQRIAPTLRMVREMDLRFDGVPGVDLLCKQRDGLRHLFAPNPPDLQTFHALLPSEATAPARSPSGRVGPSARPGRRSRANRAVSPPLRAVRR